MRTRNSRKESFRDLLSLLNRFKRFFIDIFVHDAIEKPECKRDIFENKKRKYGMEIIVKTIVRTQARY